MPDYVTGREFLEALATSLPEYRDAPCGVCYERKLRTKPFSAGGVMCDACGTCMPREMHAQLYDAREASS